MDTASIEEKSEAGGGLLLLRLGISPELARSHARHGQYVELRHVDDEGAEKKGYFVLASAPGAPEWEVLMRKEGSLGERVVSLAVGSALASTTAMGDGLPVELAADRPLLAVAAGSAIGVVESAIAARIAAGAAEKTRLLFGVRSVAETPIRPTIDRFRAAGVRVELCCSDEAPNEPDAYFGWVQTRLPAHADWLAGGYVFVGGHPELVAELRARAAEWGTDASRVHTNH